MKNSGTQNDGSMEEKNVAMFDSKGISGLMKILLEWMNTTPTIKGKRSREMTREMEELIIDEKFEWGWWFVVANKSVVQKYE